MQSIKLLVMPAATFAGTSPVTSLAEPYPMLDFGDITSLGNLIKAFSIFDLNAGGVMNVNKAPHHSQAPQLGDVVASTPAQAPIDDKTFKVHVERLTDDMSAMDISKPARRSARCQAPKVHPYKRPALTKTEQILSSHGMAKKGAVSTLLSLCIRD
jgi:hypothetical protein